MRATELYLIPLTNLLFCIEGGGGGRGWIAGGCASEFPGGGRTGRLRIGNEGWVIHSE